jgi:co-chaperonin GroES (HSP10)
MIRPIEPDKSHGGIIIPDPQKRTNANTLGRGIVLDIGPPALTPLRWDADANEWRGGVEIPTDFKIGDEVLHVGQHVSRDSWNDGERVRYCAVEEVQCVIEP